MSLWPAVVWNTIIWLATGYVVFGLGHSGWWFLLTLAISDYYSQRRRE